MLEYIPENLIVEDDIKPDTNKTYAVLLDREESESGDLAVGLVKYTDSGDREVMDEYDFFERYSDILADTGKAISPEEEWNEFHEWVNSHDGEVTISREIIDYFEMSEENYNKIEED